MKVFFYTFHDFSGIWIHKVCIFPKQWLWISKSFELELSNISYTTTIMSQYQFISRLSHKSYARSSIIILLKASGGAERADVEGQTV